VNHSTAIAYAPPPVSYDVLQRTCVACGEARPILEVTPISHAADGTPTAHVCRACAAPHRPAN
jgi:hypothetical protein